MRNGKVKILLVQIKNRNYGDSVIADCTRYLLEKILSRQYPENYTILDYSFSSDDLGQIKYVDGIVFAGGGLIKFKKELFYHRVSEIIREAQKYDIPVFLNAIGVEGYDGDDVRCLELKEALSLPCVKGISVRDDIDTLVNQYLPDSDVRIKSVMDPAVFSAKVYPITSTKTDVIGLGVARSALFTDHEIEFADEAFLLDMWKETALELERRGMRWKIFTNGLNDDEIFAEKLLAYIGHGERAPRPVDAPALVNTICSFSGIIACRMHANIIAYSLGVPSVGLVWNDKLRFWGEKIRCPERFIEADRMNSIVLCDSLQKACRKGCRKISVLQKWKTPFELAGFLKKYITPRTAEKCCKDVGENLVAVALGTLDFKFKNTNSLESFQNSVQQGYRIFEVDVRMTSDGIPVCVNGWSEDTFKKLGIPFSEELKDGIACSEFLNSRYNGALTPLTFTDFLQKYQETSEKNITAGYRLILDVGRPSDQIREQMMQSIMSCLENSKIPPETVTVRLQRKKDLETFRSRSYPCRIMYMLPNPRDGVDMLKEYRRTAEYCRKEEISTVSMRADVYTAEVRELLDANGLSACIFTYSKTEDMLSAMDWGDNLVGSNSYSPEYINALIN